jgi:protein PET117
MKLPQKQNLVANRDTKAMHAGVVRDMQNQAAKRERQLDFEMQRAMEEEYKKIQSVHDSTEIPDKVR